MLTEKIKQSESYQMFIKYSTSLIPPKKSRGKRSHGNKAVVFLKGVSDEESDDSDAKHARKRTNSRRVIKKKVLIFADDNIIPEPDVALKLGKSMSLTKAAEEEAARQVHATLERIVTESNPEPARGRPLDTMQALKAGRKSIRSHSCAGGSSKGTSTKPGVTDESIVTLTTSSKEIDDDDENIQWVDTDEEEEINDDDDDKSIDLEKTNDEFVHSEEHV
nr:hypothetical protein [Tanacetum cinerariifolium]